MSRKDVNAALLLIGLIAIIGLLVTAIYWMKMTIEEDFLSELAQLADTAKNAYLQALKASLPLVGGSDTVKPS
jgi:FtsZ-interacting cell division protein ZipA